MRPSLLTSWLLALAMLVIAGPAAADDVRQRVRIDEGWRFALGHAWDPAQDFDHGTRAFFFAKAGFGDGPAAADFDDRPWRRVDLPHDWAVELPFSERGSSPHGSKAIGRAFPENSIGWYRRELAIPASAQGRRIALEFDGVFRDSVVWINGHYLRREASGYSSFRVDLTDYLNYGGRNVVAVRVDATTQEGWWYEGAGLYRHVWLTQTDPLHVDHWGTFVRSIVTGQRAEVAVDTTVRNDGKAAASFTLEHELRDPDGMPEQPAVYQNSAANCAATGIEAKGSDLAGAIGRVQIAERGLSLRVDYPKANTLDIINVHGKTVFSGSAPAAYTYTVSKKLDAGIYFAKVTAGGHVASRRILVP